MKLKKDELRLEKEADLSAADSSFDNSQTSKQDTTSFSGDQALEISSEESIPEQVSISEESV